MSDGGETRSLAPGFLIAVPQLMDPNFRQSVVLLLQQSDEGAVGLVINRESTLSLGELCRDEKIAYQGDPEKKVRVGGPVQPEQGLVLFGPEVEDPEGRAVVDGLQVSASTRTLSRLCKERGTRFQCFAGYAGWGPGQLEREIHEGSWIVAPPDVRMIFDVAPDALWLDALQHNGIDPSAIVPGGSSIS